MSKILDFYFSFTSPYSYIAHTQLAGLAERTQCSIVYHVIDLGKIFGVAELRDESDRNRDIPEFEIMK
jgi:2-hydroxychromene-2-carboxylate isomerase